MTGPPIDDYREFLRSRWPRRTRGLSAWACGGSIAYAIFDFVFTHIAGEPDSAWRIAAIRLPWIASPVAAFLLGRHVPSWRLLPAAIIGLSLLWTLGNDWAFFALGLGGTVVQGIGIAAAFATAATVLPLTTWGRAGVFALMWFGHVALDLAWPQSRSVGERLWVDVVILAFVVTQTFVFEQFARSRQRGFQLRLDLQRAVGALEASRERAASAASAVGRLAAEVAHDVNNPLAAVKVNVRLLGEPDTPAEERQEATRDALEAIERISRIVADLRMQALAHQGLLEREAPIPTPPAGR